jgi:hypothetical protein
MAQHTDGPWKIRPNGTMSGRWLTIYVDDESWDGGIRELLQSDTIEVNVARDDDEERWQPTEHAEEIKAAVLLAAAAPSLLAACEAVLRVAEDASLPGPVYLSIAEREDLKAAVAKARGKEA